MRHVTIYTTPTCPFSRQLREFLQQSRQSFVEYNVIDEPERLTEMRQLTRGISAVPIVVLDKNKPTQKVLVGFESGSLETLLSAI